VINTAALVHGLVLGLGGLFMFMLGTLFGALIERGERWERRRRRKRLKRAVKPPWWDKRV
jgi:hypothetical protein